MKRISVRQKIILIISGLLLSLALLEIGMRIGGFIILSLQEYRNRLALKNKKTYRILCLGESTTASGGYPRMVEEILNRQDIESKFSVINKGIIGTDTGAIVSQLEDNLNKYNPDMVITMMGVNDNPETVSYEDSPGEKSTPVLKSFRMFKLARLLGKHIANKAQDTGSAAPQKRKEDISGRISPSARSGEPGEQEEAFRERTAAEPEEKRVCVELARRLGREGKYNKAEAMFKKAIDMSPEDEGVYIELGWWQKHQGKYDEAEKILKKALRINPESELAHIELGWCYKVQEEYDKAGQIFKKALEINPENDKTYVNLGICYLKQGKHGEAVETFKKAIEINQRNIEAYVELGRYYRSQRAYDKAEEIYKKAVNINPESNEICGALAHCYQEWGRPELAEKYFKKANSLRSEYYNPATRRNYQKLKEILTKRGVKPVCVQYPVRSIEPLKSMFVDREGVIFVDNEGIFKEAIKLSSYEEYFTDMFGGDFGHCTPKGNRLLAGNIANVILEECFNKNKK
ncbi:MAG: tetratricopeptide repeat protein [Candidatus Omnitrophota bacterium]